MEVKIFQGTYCIQSRRLTKLYIGPRSGILASNPWQIDNLSLLEIVITDPGHTLSTWDSNTVPLVDRCPFNSRKVWDRRSGILSIAKMKPRFLKFPLCVVPDEDWLWETCARGLKGGKAEVKQQPLPWGSAWVHGCGSRHPSQLPWQFTFSVQGATTGPAQPPAPVRPPPSATPGPGPGVCASPWQRVPSTSANNPRRPGLSCGGQMQVPRGPSEPSPTSQPAFLPDWSMVISGPPQSLPQSLIPCHSQRFCFSGQTLTDPSKTWWRKSDSC